MHIDPSVAKIDISQPDTAVVAIEASTAKRGEMDDRPSGSSGPDHELRKLQTLGVYLLLVLGMALVGAGITVIGLVSTSPAAVGIGAGVVFGAGLVSIFFASRLKTAEDDDRTADVGNPAAPEADYPQVDDQHSDWPPNRSKRTFFD